MSVFILCLLFSTAINKLVNSDTICQESKKCIINSKIFCPLNGSCMINCNGEYFCVNETIYIETKASITTLQNGILFIKTFPKSKPICVSIFYGKLKALQKLTQILVR